MAWSERVRTALHILLVTARYPWPPRRGDQVRACQLLELLAPEHHVTLLAPRPAAGQPPPAALPALPAGTALVTYRHGLPGAVNGLARAATRGFPMQSGWFYSSDLRRQLRLLAPRADLAVLQLVRLAMHRADLGGTPALVDLIDDLALNFARRAAVDRWWLRPALALEARLLERAQRRLAGRAAGVLLASERDRRELTRGLRAGLADRVRTVTLAVEPSGGATGTAAGAAGLREPPALFEPPALGEPPALAEPLALGAPPVLIFTGNLGYFVNDDAISWWLRDVWPALAARRPDLRLVVAGDRPRPRLRRIVAAAGKVQGAVTLAESPPDMQRLLAGATVALAPMRSGSGVPVKILEAWAQGVPVVASPWAAAGTTGVPGEDLLVASSPRQWTDVLSGLLQDASARRRLAASGQRRLQADYSRQAVKAQLLAAVAVARGGRV